MLALGVCLRSHARALAAGLPHQDHIWITIAQFVCFHKNEFDEILCEPDPTKYARSFARTIIET